MDIIYTPLHQRHAPDQVLVEGRPFVSEETPARAETIRAALQAARLGLLLPPIDHGLAPLWAVHTPDYLAFLQGVYAEHAALYPTEAGLFPQTFASRQPRRRPVGLLNQVGYYAYGVGTPLLAGTWEAAYWSAQCALTAADRVLHGARVAYALCRPPGHHAGPEQYGGFCFLNNAASVARYLQACWPNAPVAILDIDYHHGNGTQEIFYSDPTVLYISLHAHPDTDYPYFWGAADETGAGPGLGFNLNLPLPPHTREAEYLAALDLALASIQRFAPRYLVISAGFDIAQGDPVGSFEISISGFTAIARRIASLALPCVIVQEGGYQLDQLGAAACAFLHAIT
jgi:acetoin utilization deacetylase AcuC-like enzyme